MSDEPQKIVYMSLRKRAWQARLAGDIHEAAHHEANAELYGYREWWADEADELEANPGTTDEDWPA